VLFIRRAGGEGERRERPLSLCSAEGDTEQLVIPLKHALILQFISLPARKEALKTFSLEQIFAREYCVDIVWLRISVSRPMPLGTCKCRRQGLPHPMKGSGPEAAPRVLFALQTKSSVELFAVKM
jgi:hypothetical protein